MKKFPFYKQLDAMDCGPSCLRMIAKHYGKVYSLQSLREKSYFTREGVSLLGISDAAEKIGFRTLSVQISFDQIKEEAPTPFIAHWRQQHFVVVHKFKKDKVLTESDCGQVCISAFSVNIPQYTEAYHFNSCLNRKVSLDIHGNIKNCPSQNDSFGNIKNTLLKEAIKNKQFQSLWKIEKDDIKICKDCEYRYICTDCRIFIQDKNDQFSKPSKCTYDPYTTTWH